MITRHPTDRAPIVPISPCTIVATAGIIVIGDIVIGDIDARPIAIIAAGALFTAGSCRESLSAFPLSVGCINPDPITPQAGSIGIGRSGGGIIDAMNPGRPDGSVLVLPATGPSIRAPAIIFTSAANSGSAADRKKL